MEEKARREPPFFVSDEKLRKLLPKRRLHRGAINRGAEGVNWWGTATLALYFRNHFFGEGKGRSGVSAAAGDQTASPRLLVRRVCELHK